MKATNNSSPINCDSLRFSVGATLALTVVAIFILLLHLS